MYVVRGVEIYDEDSFKILSTRDVLAKLYLADAVEQLLTEKVVTVSGVHGPIQLDSISKLMQFHATAYPTSAEERSNG